MKKIIVGASLLIAIATPAFAAKAPTVTLGGRIDTHVGFRNQESAFKHSNPAAPTTANKLHEYAIVNDTKLDINVDGMMNNGTKYGGLIRLHADTSKATNDEVSNGDKTMVYVQNDKIGRLEAGNYPGAGGQLEMDIDNYGVGSYGVNGFWSQWPSGKTARLSGLYTAFLASEPSDTAGFEFIVSPNLPTNYSGHNYSDAPKVTFFTQPIPQITVGISYIPDLDSTGTIAGVAGKQSGPVFDADRVLNPATFRNIFSGGIRGETKIKQIGIKATVTGEVGKSKTPELRDLKAVEGGLMFDCNNFKIGGTAGTAFKSWTLKTPNAGTKQGTFYWTLGASHQVDKLGYSVGYMSSRKAGGAESIGHRLVELQPAAAGLQPQFSDTDYNKFHLITGDVDYQVAPGLLGFIGVAYFDFDEGGALTSNKGTITLIGSRLLF